MSALAEAVVDQLVVHFPGFRPRWLEARGDKDEERLPYIELAEFARFVPEDIFEDGDEADIRRVFNEVAANSALGDNEVKTLVTVGFLEDLQNFALQRNHELVSFTRFLSPRLLQDWNALISFWSGEIGFIP